VEKGRKGGREKGRKRRREKERKNLVYIYKRGGGR
jgi:hypothetical protein